MYKASPLFLHVLKIAAVLMVGAPLAAVSAPNISKEVQEDLQALKRMSRGFNHVAEKALGAVVSIETSMQPRLGHEGALAPAPLQDEFFRRFFHLPPTQPRMQTPPTNLGSGVIVSASGYIVTNEHVIRNAEEIKIITDDNQELLADLVGSDPDTDLAVLKVSAPQPLPYLTLGDSDALHIGEWVIAIGTPRKASLKSSLTVGVVSAKGRGDLDLNKIEEYIQTDAAINMGNSGGPLLNVDGEIIGINNSMISTDGTYIGIGFAIPSKIVKIVSQELIEHGRVRRGTIGIIYKSTTDEVAKAYNLPNNNGVVVTEVIEGSPASEVGLRYGDVIIEVNGKEITNSKVLYKEIAFTKPGKKLLINVNREGKIIPMQVGVSLEHKHQAEEATPKQSFGLTLREEETKVPGGMMTGFEITAVDPLSPSYKAGVRPAMRLIGINRSKPKSVEEAYELLSQSWKKKQVLLLLEHGEQSMFVTINI